MRSTLLIVKWVAAGACVACVFGLGWLARDFPTATAPFEPAGRSPLGILGGLEAHVRDLRGEEIALARYCTELSIAEGLLRCRSEPHEANAIKGFRTGHEARLAAIRSRISRAIELESRVREAARGNEAPEESEAVRQALAFLYAVGDGATIPSLRWQRETGGSSGSPR